MKNLIIGISIFIIGQSLVWIQTNGQFIWPWFKRNPVLVAMIGGSIISYLFIFATRLIAEYYGGIVWPSRFIGFSCGMLTFTFLTYFMLNEGLTTKTLISLALAICILCVQLFWK
jgi:hypothetical protein